MNPERTTPGDQLLTFYTTNQTFIPLPWQQVRSDIDELTGELTVTIPSNTPQKYKASSLLGYQIYITTFTNRSGRVQNLRVKILQKDGSNLDFSFYRDIEKLKEFTGALEKYCHLAELPTQNADELKKSTKEFPVMQGDDISKAMNEALQVYNKKAFVPTMIFAAIIIAFFLFQYLSTKQ